jgi:TonB family protein
LIGDLRLSLIRGLKMHDCEVTQRVLPDLLFGEVEASRRDALLEEVGACPPCADEYHALKSTLRALDVALDEALPPESFWSGYGERLRTRMAQEIGRSVWRPVEARAPLGYYRPTILEDAGLVSRLRAELRGVAREYELTWPEFRRDPFGFAVRVAAGYGQLLRRAAAQDYAMQSALAPLCLVLLIAVGLAASENRCRFLSLFSQRCEQALADNPYRDLQVIGFVGDEIPREQKPPEREGAAGTNRGDGGGSKAKPEKSGGGGGGGRESSLPTSSGKVAQASPQDQILTPSVRPPLTNPSLAVEPTLKGDPLLLPPNPNAIDFGDPNSTSVVPSDGPGSGGGQGTGHGTGQGPGDGKGHGPGYGENTGNGRPIYGGGGRGGSGDNLDLNRIYRAPEVTRRAVITHRPEPNFTEAARLNNVTGVVRLRAVLTAGGQVTSISVLKGLPDGLTEKAIEAARQIRFTPAQRDGRAVSQWVTIEYNFNIY